MYAYKKIYFLCTVLLLGFYTSYYACSIQFKNDVPLAGTVYVAKNDFGPLVKVNFGQNFPFDSGIDFQATVLIKAGSSYTLYVYAQQPTADVGLRFKRLYKITMNNCPVNQSWPVSYSQIKNNTVPFSFLQIERTP